MAEPFRSSRLIWLPIRARAGLVHPPLIHEPLDRDVDGNVDDDRRGQALARILPEQGEVEHHDPIGVAVGIDLALDLVLHRRVHDAVEVLQCGLVVEHDRCDGGAVE